MNYYPTKIINNVEHEWIPDPFGGSGSWHEIEDLYLTPVPVTDRNTPVEAKEQDTKEDGEAVDIAKKAVTSMDYGDLYAHQSYVESEMKRRIREKYLEENPDYEPLKYLPKFYGQKAIRMVLEGVSAEEAFRAVCDQFGYSDSDRERFRKAKYYTTKYYPRKDLIEIFKQRGFRSLTRKKCLKLKYTNHKQAPTLMSLLRNIEDAVSLEAERRRLEKLKVEIPKFERSEAIAQFFKENDPSEMGRPQLMGFAQQMKEWGFTYKQIADRVGKAEVTIKRWFKPKK